MAIQSPAIFAGTHPGPQFMTDDGAEQLVWSKGRASFSAGSRNASMKEVRVEDVTDGHRGSAVLRRPVSFKDISRGSVRISLDADVHLSPIQA